MSSERNRPRNRIAACGCSYGHSYDNGGGFSASGWDEDQFPEMPCVTHKPAEDARRMKEAEVQAENDRMYKENRLKHLVEREDKIRADFKQAIETIQRERYRIVHGHDPVALQEQYEAAQKEVARIAAIRATLPPMYNRDETAID